MSFGKPLLLALLATTTIHTATFAQETDAPADFPSGTDQEYVADEDIAEIVVVGQRRRGTVVGDIPPEIELDEQDILSYGTGDISELLDALAPQTRSGRGRGEGRPVVLLNGRRISGFREIGQLPPEALERVEILPEEVALKYGYRADQRVVNFVLKENFRAITAEAEYGFPTAGGRSSYEADLNVLRIGGDGRWSVDLEYQRDTPLFESERDLIQSEAGRPYDLIGNVGLVGGGEIDPALSVLAGETVMVAAVPDATTGGAPTLGDFVPGANAANVTALGRYRTLLAGTEQFSVNGNINRILFDDISATLNASYEDVASESYFGLPSASLVIPETNPYSPFAGDVTLYRYFDARPLQRESATKTGHLGLALNGDLDPWRWSFTANYDRSNAITRTDTGADITQVQALIDAGDPDFNPFSLYPPSLIGSGPRDLTRSTNQSANAEAVFNGPIVDLPAGDLTTSLKAGVETRSFESQSFRSGVEQLRDLSRDRGEVQANFDIPIASRRRDVLADLGNLSANANFAFDRLSDFGTLKTIGYGINWSPIDEVRLIASVTDEEGAPTVQQLGDPTTLTPNVPVFDFLTGQTVDVTRIEGGNPALLADNRHVLKIGARVTPWSETNLSISADYNRSRTRDVIASFPTATPEIEAAFPERFVRDAEGRLLRINSRPVNFARADREELRWGVNFFKSLGADRPRRERGGENAEGGEGGSRGPRGAGGGGRRGGGGGGGGGMGRFGGRGGGDAGRLQLSLYHTWHLEDSILIRDGVPELDLLNGSAAGNRGGRSEHEIEFQAGVFKDGLGARLSANWQSGTFVRGRPDLSGGAASDLFFSDFATVNLRLFANLDQQESLVRRYPWLDNTRVTLSVNNLLDSRLGVRDASGATPLSYQPDYLDPLGRSVRLSVRKQFF